MRKLVLSTSLVALLAVSACGKKAEEADGPGVSREASSNIDLSPRTPAIVAPGIDPKSAPGLAFAYRYDFVLPDKNIAAAQEASATACERLGPSQCRITGMRYSLIDDQRTTGELHFKLAPELARQFGKDGIATIEKAAGKLVDAEITGDDVSTTIDSADRARADATVRLAEIEGKLKAGGIKDAERGELEAQARDLRDQMAQAKDTKAGAEAQLANTPMTFNYAGDIGFSFGGNPVGDALHSAWSSLSTMVWFVLMAVGIVLPWALLLALIILVWRSRVGRTLRGFLKSGNPPKPAPETVG